MSKQLLVVDLPDDGKCEKCRIPCDKRPFTLERTRPADCPLTPVGKVTKYEVKFFEDKSVGIFGGNETVTVSYAGDMGGEPGEFEEYIRECLNDWADGGRACILRDEKEATE